MKQPVKIRGAGLKGLSLSFFLKQQGIDSILYEKSSRAGGWIKTDQSTGFLFEAGPRGFRPETTSLKLIQDLELEDELIYPDKAAKKRFILSGGKLRSTSFFLPRLLAGLLKDLVFPALKPEIVEKLTIREYFDKRLGSYCTSHLLDPLVSGIFAGDIDKLSASHCFPSMTQKGSILKSIFNQPKTPLLSFKNGMQTLVDRLKEHACIKYNETISDPDYDCSPKDNYPHESIVAVNLGWKKGSLPIQGFGYLIPQSEKEEEVLGVVMDSMTFPMQNNHPKEIRLTVMMGGAHHPDCINYSESKSAEIALRSIHKHLKINRLSLKDPDAILVHYAKKAIPQPWVGIEPKGVGVNGVIKEASLMGNGCLQK